jgi:ribosomal protein L7Ae-like RNA K-turn-binding protein
MNEGENLLLFIGLANRAGKVRAGSEQVKECAERERARLLLLAKDAADGTKRIFFKMAGDRDIKIYELFSKESLGKILGKRDVSILAICDRGFAKAMEAKIRNINGGETV